MARQEVLRTHTTPLTIKYLADHPQPPVKAFCIDRVYRREAIDATHTPEFDQLEGVIMDRGQLLQPSGGAKGVLFQDGLRGGQIQARLLPLH